MFSKSVVHVEVLSLQLCQKTEKWAKNVRDKNITNLQHLVIEGRELMDCGIRLMQVRVKDNTHNIFQKH